MKILGGSNKGRKLKSFHGLDIRPTPNRVKESLFNTLGAKISGSDFLDLFAGAGGVGIEALSRGAGQVVFVDQSRKALALIRQNLALCKSEGKAEILGIDIFEALKLLSVQGARFDIVFLDPPYRSLLHDSTLIELSRKDFLKPEGIVIAEHYFKQQPATLYGSLTLIKRRRFGDTELSYYGYPLLNNQGAFFPHLGQTHVTLF
ncbi:MAG: 16S rRNA (guanine(966)-N(2))-methyltransferase RsmD [Candidatus Tectomicrobia bacterium]|nr:16S rRNA (guanine(966)-N(2))-methyltransferase RsmD [Candidatus Tectomicrobia bacterium]